MPLPGAVQGVGGRRAAAARPDGPHRPCL